MTKVVRHDVCTHLVMLAIMKLAVGEELKSLDIIPIRMALEL
jgi:hypothetical protein